MSNQLVVTGSAIGKLRFRSYFSGRMKLVSAKDKALVYDCPAEVRPIAEGMARELGLTASHNIPPRGAN